jgi:hypothetical protein
MRKMQYDVVDADSLHGLSVLVNSMLEHGWIPQGGICSHIEKDSKKNYVMFSQAISRYCEDEYDIKPG